jgi:Xaa-Pro aminopeptidase
MRMLETTLLTGPFDWDEALMPRAEFDARLDAVRALLRERSIDGLIVGGLSPEHGALGYLTGFTPKLGPALAFIPRQGDLRIVCSGGGAMLSSARRLTFVADVRAMRDPGHEFAAWLHDSKAVRLALWGDYAITQAVRVALDRIAPSPLIMLDGELDALRRNKSERERALIVRACTITGSALDELRVETKSGRGVRAAAIAAERAAYAAGAQDVRMLMSMRDGGMPQPLIGPHDPHVDPLLACIAVRFAGYWAEASATITATRSPALATADASLASILQAIRPGIGIAELNAAASQALAGEKLHPFVAENLGNGIGLSREEGPLLATTASTPLQEGDVCTLRSGAYAGGADSAIVSAMVRVGPSGAEILWK